MSVDAASGTSGTSGTSSDTTTTTKKTGLNSLGQDAFLKLLTTQLQHQDPTKPMEDTQFITQLATFSSLEKLTTIADATSSMNTLFGALNDTTSTSDTSGN
jgi:flagellar basal-body rod modification protein FlgD